MTTFVLIAAALVAVACAWVMVPLLRRRHPQSVDRESSNLAVLRDQRSELEADLANGAVSVEQYDTARAELDRRVLEETRVAEGEAATPLRSGAWTAAALAMVMPVAAAVLYILLGTPSALAPGAAKAAAAAAGGDHATSAQQIESMVEQVKQKLAADPSNIEGWVVLARTYYVTQRPKEAAAAFERAVALAPDDADLLADYADTLGVVQGRSLGGKPAELVERALKANPNHWKANALAGTIAFEKKNYAQAVAHWERAKAAVPPGSPIAQSMDGSIAEARQLGGLPGSSAAAPATPAVVTTMPPAPRAAAAAPQAPPSASPAPGANKVAGKVRLSPTLAAGVSPEDAVYVFARPADGSRMPLALLRKQVKDLPFAFALDDSMAMSPSAKISDHGQVIVGARVSRSGSPMPQSGDLEALSAPVKLGSAAVEIVIDKRLP